MKNKGFTLVELLAVIAILAILVIIALPNVLKMFNESKKNSFLTEAKTVYSEVSKKYITESMKGNKLTYISSEDDTKLEMTGRDLQYCVLLNTDGSVKSMKVSNGEWIAELPAGKKITDLNASNVTEGNLDDDESCPKTPKSFANDSWVTISNAVKNNNTSKYKVRDTKEVDLGTYGKHTLRISNMSTPGECNQEGFSQSACGFVVEFTDIITTHNMNDTATNEGGWPASSMYTYLNNDIYNALPEDLKGVIKDTVTVSGHCFYDTDNYTSTDKLYLLSTHEVYENGISYTITNDRAWDKTRQLDYYKNIGVTTNNYDGAIKKNNGSDAWWWLRSAYYHYSGDFMFHYVYSNGDWGGLDSDNTIGVSPAFRIG
ncbi:MAG: DUF6273 domain-containing protein [Clostridium sp.]|nr:DUF6273 domain-containing protein [Clostridium sp.]